MNRIRLDLDDETVILINEDDLIKITLHMLEPRTDGQFSGKGYWLQPNLEWHVGVDDDHQIVLVATRKK